MNGVIDRIEENKIVIETEPDGEILVLPKEQLPNGREGDAVVEINGAWHIDVEKTQALLQAAAERRRKLLGRSK